MNVKLIASIIIVFILISAAGVAVIIQIYSDSNIIDEDILPDNGKPGPVGNQTFPDAVNTFAFNFLKQLYSANNNNVFISSYSIFTALAMTYEGAKEDTADEMADVLGIQQDNTSFHMYMKTLYDELNTETTKYNISTANALWVQKNLDLIQSYLTIIRNYYGGDATKVDYSDPATSAEIINQWVENQTNGLIKDLISESAIDPLTALILTNAIYFKGMWKTQFDPENTSERTFHIQDGDSIDVPTMSLTNTKDVFNYTETEHIQILELPYTGNEISMVILLPKDGYLSSIINIIDTTNYSEWIDSMIEHSVDIYLPKFKTETSYTLNEYLQNLGMNTPFSTSADFTGIIGSGGLFISQILHKAFIEVNEEGTEAAAATAVIMTLSQNGGPSRIVFNCDHPFMYLIHHKPTGTILFMGTINDPSV
jgi:serpin B